MRFDRIDIQGYGRLTGSFRFPGEGLGVWGAPNQAGKTRLTLAVAAALYSEDGPIPESVPGEAPWISVHLVRDDGEPLVVTRDLASGAVRVTDATRQDVTTRFRNAEDGVEVGEALLGLTRSQFLEAAIVGHERLRETPGNPTLLSLLKHGRGRSAAPARNTASAFPPAPSPPPAAPAPRIESQIIEDDLQIIRSAAEELGYLQGTAAPDREAPGAAAAPPPASSPGASPLAREDPDEPGLETSTRIRRMRESIRFFDGCLEEKQNELRSHSMMLQDTQSEAERLSALTGAEPRDVEKLGSLIDAMKDVQSKREQLRIDDSKFRRGLLENDVPIERVEELDRVFREISQPDRAFLENYREGEMVRRGTQALLRSECRLDETRIQEIGVSRGTGARLAILPLGLATLGLGASIAVNVTGWALGPSQWYLGLGFAGASLAALLLWRARGLGERDREELLAALEVRHQQLAAIDREMQDAATLIATIAGRFEIEKATDVLDLFEQWKASRQEVHELATFRKRAEEIDGEIVSIRQKLHSFHPSQDDDASGGPGSPDLEKLYQDYVRFFELQQQLAREEARGIRLEEELADTESERADLTERLGRALARAGIDASRDLDEAVERFALKRVDVEIDPPARSSHEREAERDEALAARPGDTSWTSAISARTEAIARRFIPEIRQIEIDANLAPTLKLDPKGPRLGMRELERELSSGALDQLCLALRLSIVETVSSSGERFPVLLDDPLVRADDARHDLALDFLVDDAAERNQVVLLTSQGTRVRWFLHQVPHLQERVVGLTDPPPAPAAPTTSAASSPSPESSPPA